MSPTTAQHGRGNASPRVLLCVGTPLGAGCSPSATSPGMRVNTLAEVDGVAGGRAELPALVAPAALGSLCPSLTLLLGGSAPAELWGAGARLTCAMSSSSCSRWILARLYCSSSTSAKWAMLRMDSFSCSVSTMSWGAQGSHGAQVWHQYGSHTTLRDSRPAEQRGRHGWTGTTHPSRTRWGSCSLP